jgi:uncharacterized membrane protein YeaQ/YmgE (transglycosylase-associated protein family)
MLWFILSLIILGLVVGLLGRLVVPGPSPVGLLGTIVIGIVGSVLGGVAAEWLFRQGLGEEHPSLVSFVLAVVIAALLVLLVSGRRRSYWRGGRAV